MTSFLQQILILFLLMEKSFGQYNSFDWNYYNRDPRQNNVRFGYQNPILFAPTKPPILYFPPTNSQFSQNQDFLQDTRQKISNTFEIRCPPGFARSAFTGDCVAFFHGRVSTTTTRRPIPFLPKCPQHWVLDRSSRRCIPRIIPRRPTTWKPFARPSGQFGHQNPVLVAPTTTETSTTTTEAPTTTETRNPCDLNSPFHRIDRKTNKCFPLGSTEPCRGENMVFYQMKEDALYGECDCLQDTKRPLVYHAQRDTCFFIFQQAYCHPSEWLTLSKSPAEGGLFLSSCTPNPCRDYGAQQTLAWDWTRNDLALDEEEGILPVFEAMMCVPHNHFCHRLPNGSLTFPQTERRTILAFEKGNVEPTCHTKPLTSKDREPFSRAHASAPAPPIECQPGSQLLKCKNPSEMDMTMRQSSHHSSHPLKPRPKTNQNLPFKMMHDRLISSGNTSTNSKANYIFLLLLMLIVGPIGNHD